MDSGEVTALKWQNPIDLARKADEALYLAKQAGRNRVEIA